MADGDHDDTQFAVLTVLPPETTDDTERRIQGITTERFRLLESTHSAAPTVTPDDRVAVTTTDSDPTTRQLTYEALSHDAQDRLEPTIESIITQNEQRFIGFYNDAQPISLRRHQLDLLPTIGEGRREAIMRERERRPFEDFTDLETRVDGLTTPHAILAERIITEHRSENVKYALFVDRSSPDHH